MECRSQSSTHGKSKPRTEKCNLRVAQNRLPSTGDITTVDRMTSPAHGRQEKTSSFPIGSRMIPRRGDGPRVNANPAHASYSTSLGRHCSVIDTRGSMRIRNSLHGTNKASWPSMLYDIVSSLSILSAQHDRSAVIDLQCQPSSSAGSGYRNGFCYRLESEIFCEVGSAYMTTTAC